MNITQIEENVTEMLNPLEKSEFIYNLLLSYNAPKSSITRLKKGSLNLSKVDGEIAWKKKLLFKETDNPNLHETINDLIKDERNISHNPRFIIVTNYEALLAIDTVAKETLDIDLEDLPKSFDFFLPWAGFEKAGQTIENIADVKAAEKMAKLYDEIRKDNPVTTKEEVHGLNVFLSRLLFCFYAEDTGIFEEKGIFTNSVISYTKKDGSDLAQHLERVFTILNLEKRQEIPAYLIAFPYVNGGLFKDKYNMPIFNQRSRDAIIENGKLNWSDINPDIFGSMIQAVVTPELRNGLGMHYTSVPNIMKVINPLFLDELYAEFESSKDSKVKLEKLQNRLTKIKIFDPACGSGNFLIIAYKEIRRLEMLIFKRLNEIDEQIYSKLSEISLSQFYGIELDDFASEIAMLSLWLTEHQMNIEFLEEFGSSNPTLPLKDAGRIWNGNATRLGWEEVCEKREDYEIYVLGNPPYLGARLLSEEQKEDMKIVFKDKDVRFNDLDYISCWFLKGAEYIKEANAKFAFVSTNSICQGSHVGILWPTLLQNNLEIDFAHQSFKWTNNAKSKAAVICIIAGLRNHSVNPKFIYSGQLRFFAKNISPYLIEGDNVFVTGRSTSISGLPPMSFGSMPNDGGYLTLSTDEYREIVTKYPLAKKYIKKLIGSREFINDIPRWCLWIDQKNLKEAIEIPEIKRRVELVKEQRLLSKRIETRKLAEYPFEFGEVRHKNTDSIIIPAVSSERREYIPIGFLDENSVISNAAHAIYDAEAWIFGCISSRIHMVWMKAVSGKLKSDYRYSATLTYNTFPIPKLSKKSKEGIEKVVYQILAQRENYSEKTMAELYDPEKMPDTLREAHRQLDMAVERCYRYKPFDSDEERLEYLLKLYEKMILEEGVS